MAIAVGVGVTLFSAIVPARRAVRIAPVAALVQQSEEPITAMPRGAVVRVRLIGLAGIALIVFGASNGSIALVGVGGLAILIATTSLAPLLARHCRTRSNAP